MDATEEKQSTRKQLIELRSDACAITVSYGLLASLVNHIEREGEWGQIMRRDSGTTQLGEEMIDRAASTMRSAREKIAELLEELGDHQNAWDGVPGFMPDISRPVYDVMHRLAAGEILDM